MKRMPSRSLHQQIFLWINKWAPTMADKVMTMVVRIKMKMMMVIMVIMMAIMITAIAQSTMHLPDTVLSTLGYNSPVRQVQILSNPFYG